MDNYSENMEIFPAEKRLDRLLKLHIKIQELADKLPLVILAKYRKKIIDKLFQDEQLQKLISDIKENKIPPSEADDAIKHAAERFTKVFSSIAFFIGTEPIPGPDIFFLIPLQTMLISLIAYISGRDLNKKTGTEFLASLGVNVGAGFIFREAARGLIKLIPGPGNLISGGVAASGTYAIGTAAIAYYLEGKKNTEIKKIYIKEKEIAKNIQNQ